MTVKEENNLAFLTHLSGFGGYVFPLGSIIIPLIIWETKKEDSKFLDHNGKEAINFNLSYLLYTLILSMSTFPFLLGSFFRNLKNEVIDFNDFNDFNFHLDFSSNHLFGLFSVASIISLLFIAKVVLIIMAAMSAHKGEEVKYPLTIKFIK